MRNGLRKRASAGAPLRDEEPREPLHPERKVGLKTIRTTAASPSDVEQFKAEFRTMAKLAHPNVARAEELASRIRPREGTEFIEVSEPGQADSAGSPQPSTRRPGALSGAPQPWPREAWRMNGRFG